MAIKSHLITRWLGAWRKRGAIERYLSSLPRQLVEDYGRGGPYTAAQVEASVDRAKLSREFVAYAQTLFCSADELLLRHPDRDRYDLLRREVALAYFGSKLRFTYDDAARAARRRRDVHYPGYDQDPPANSLTG